MSPAPKPPLKGEPPVKMEPVLKSLRRAGDVSTTVVAVGDVRFGDGSYPVIAGPVAVESETQMLAVAHAVAAAGGSVLRAGTYRAETSPYGFKGLGEDGLWMLEKAGYETGLPTVTEVIHHGQAAATAEHVDMLEIGPDNMQNFTLLRDAGKTGKPVLIHRGASATIDEWLMSAEYVMAEGNDQVVLCERGSRTFDPRTTDTLDISAVPAVQRLSHLPVVVDPSPGRADTSMIIPLALAARSVGADGLSVLVHPDPAHARSGNGGQLAVEGFEELMDRLGIPSLRDEIDRIDRQLVELIRRRLHSSVEIARIKHTRGLPLRSPDREAELLDEVRDEASSLGIDPDYLAELMTVVLDHSRRAQHHALEGDRPSEAGQPSSAG